MILVFNNLPLFFSTQEVKTNKSLKTNDSKYDKRRQAIDKLIETEQRFLLQNFSISYLKEETGLSENFILHYFQQKYQLPFEFWLRSVRVNYLVHLFLQYGGALSLREYAMFTGYSNIQGMLDDFKAEKGEDFPEPLII